MTVPQASIIIVNYNGGDAVLACLDSVLRADAADGEVIVVDNASTDGSVEAVQTRFASVKLIRSGENVGFGAGNNLGARAACGEYLVFLNPDTQVKPGWLEALCAPLMADQTIGLTTAKILLLAQPGRINTCGNAIHLTGLTLCRGMGRPQNLYGEQDEVTAVSGAAFAIRRETFEALGGFADEFFLYMEDTDLSWRAQLAGWRCVYVPQSIVYHDYALRFGPRKTFYQERNRSLMLLQNLRWPTLFVLLPALLLGEIVTWGFVLLRDRANWTNKLQAYRRVIERWPVMMQRRRIVQALRKVRDRDLLRRMAVQLDFGQTADGPAALAAQLVFTPLFFGLKMFALALVWW